MCHSDSESSKLDDQSHAYACRTCALDVQSAELGPESKDSLGYKFDSEFWLAGVALCSEAADLTTQQKSCGQCIEFSDPGDFFCGPAHIRIRY